MSKNNNSEQQTIEKGIKECNIGRRFFTMPDEFQEKYDTLSIFTLIADIAEAERIYRKERTDDSFVHLIAQKILFKRLVMLNINFVPADHKVCMDFKYFSLRFCGLLHVYDKNGALRIMKMFLSKEDYQKIKRILQKKSLYNLYGASRINS